MSKDLINPLVECTIADCPHCGSPLLLVDSEMTYMELDSQGFPIDAEVTYNRVEGLCYNCGNSYPYIRSGMRYVPYSIFYKPDPVKEALIKKQPSKNPFLQK